MAPPLAPDGGAIYFVGYYAGGTYNAVTLDLSGNIFTRNQTSDGKPGVSWRIN